MLSQLLTLRHLTLSSPTSSMPPSTSTSTSSRSLQPLLLSTLQPSSRHHPHLGGIPPWNSSDNHPQTFQFSQLHSLASPNNLKIFHSLSSKTQLASHHVPADNVCTKHSLHSSACRQPCALLHVCIHSCQTHHNNMFFFQPSGTSHKPLHILLRFSHIFHHQFHRGSKHPGHTFHS